MFNNHFKKNQLLEILGILLLGSITIPFMIYSFLFFLNISISSTGVWFVFITYLLICYLYLKKHEQLTIHQIVICYFLLFLSLLISFIISGYFIDYSYDGQGYQGEAILQIANGWNPTLNNLKENEYITLVINHFAKASWIMGAFYFKLTSIFECSKSINIILVISNACFLHPFISKWFNRYISLVITVLIAFNPVILNMYLSNMLDTQIVSLLFIFIILLYQYFINKSNKIIILILLVMSYCINLKFTLVGYFIIFIFGFFIYLLVQKKIKLYFKFLVYLGLIYLVSLLIFGYNTYTKNIIQYHHPFYPFKGDSSIESGQLPNSIVQAKDYSVGNPIVNIVKSNFASTSFSYACTNPIKYKFPLTFNRYELERFAFAGVMLGGYGVWFSGVILISIFMLMYFIFKRYKYILKEDFALYLFIATVLGSIFINPLGYVARYSPQYYLIPFVILIFFQIRFPALKKIQRLLLIVLIINSFLICGYTYYNFIVTKTIRQQMNYIQSQNKSVGVDFKSSTAKRQLFEAYKINIHPLELKPNQIPDTLFRSEVIYKID